MTGTATHYGAAFEGLRMGCGGTYRGADPTIVAVGATLAAAAPCGTAITVCGAAGCIDGRRTDYCPGCAGAWVDLSESGIAHVCGVGVGRCVVEIVIDGG